MLRVQHRLSSGAVEITSPPNPKHRLMWKEWVTAILGLAVIAVPFLGLAGSALMWALVVLGAVTAVLGFWSATQETTQYRSSSRLQHQ